MASPRFGGCDLALSRATITRGMALASVEKLRGWIHALEARRDNATRFIPEWPALAESFQQDISAIEAHLATRGVAQ